jgi:hypothetical protein
MAELKTKQTDESVTKFLNTVEDEKKRKDCFEIVEIMRQVTGMPPKMWGTAIIGFGRYHYKYESGHEGDMCLVGLSPRKQNIVLYGMGVSDKNELFLKLGKYKTGKSCLYINKLSDIDVNVLRQIVGVSFQHLQQKYK